MSGSSSSSGVGQVADRRRRCPSNQGLAEEAPFASKDVEWVVGVVERAGLARPVARLVPIGVVKG